MTAEKTVVSNSEKRTFSLPAEHTAFIDAKVSSGAYASGSEVVRAGLRALQERDAAVDRWLREEVAPVYDAMKADPARSLPATEVFAEVRGHHAARRKGKKVKRRAVNFAPEARDDLLRLYDYIADAAGPITAISFIERLEGHCLALELGSERGHLRDDVRPGLRILGFERSVTIAFVVDETSVTILRLSIGERIGKGSQLPPCPVDEPRGAE